MGSLFDDGDDAAAAAGAARRDPPLIDFYPDAPPLLFSLDLALGAERVRVAMSPLGAVRVLPVEGLADAAPAF